mmetsp:Transcript_70284/g.111082  ORF Transcript_70284/g.111082 Transcript_70284/m.111082 type:complete len:87 (+) Transcript_70284:92-352(+)
MLHFMHALRTKTCCTPNGHIDKSVCLMEAHFTGHFGDEMCACGWHDLDASVTMMIDLRSLKLARHAGLQECTPNEDVLYSERSALV